MRFKGLLFVFLVSVTIVFFVLTLKVGKTPAIQTDIDRFVQAEVELTRANMQALQKIVASFVASEGRTPENLQELRTAGLMTSGAIDAWGTDFRYERRSESAFRLVSAGKDKIFGTADDIIIED